ncbi:MAG: lysylphosphatidylglycerol synthase domain-containing protein [Clostridia bacterium]
MKLCKNSLLFWSLLYILVPIAVLFFSLMPKLMSSILKWLLKIGVKLKLIKDYDKKLNKTLNTLTEYRLVFKDLGKSFWTIFICAALSVLHHYSIMSIPYFVMRVSGINVSWVEITVMTIYIYAAITFIPTPGNSGAAEGTFYALFSILQGGYLFWGMMLWRFSVFYLIIIVGLVLIFVDYVIRFKRISRVTAELEAAENRHKEIIESNRKQ